MANGTDSEEFVVCSRVRAGLKREFAFALKAQAEISGSLGRTRTRRPPNGGEVAKARSANQRNKKLKISVLKEAENGTNNDRMQVLVEDQTAKEVEKVNSNPATNRNDCVLENDVNLSAGVEQESDSISDEEVRSGVVDIMSDDEPKSNLVESERRVELNNDAVGPVCKEEAVNDLGESVINGEERTRMAESGREDEKMNDSVNGGNMEHNPINKEAISDRGIVSVSGDYVDGMENVSPEKRLKPITRSALKREVVSPAEKHIEEVKSMEICEGDDCAANSPGTTLRTPLQKQGVITLKKIKLKKKPTKLKELLDTGILEGFTVKYVRGPRVRAATQKGLLGVISGCGILCSCSACKGASVVTPNQFELHAGSSNKRPPEYMYLENGNTLRDVLNACKCSPLDALEACLKDVIGCSSRLRSTMCLNCKGSIPETVDGKANLVCQSCLESEESHASPKIAPDSTERFVKSELSSKTSPAVPKSTVRSKGQGRLTRKDLRLHKLVFEEDVLPDGTEVAYYARGKKLLVGYKKGLGIFCTCCNAEVSPSTFEAHAGWASRRKPYLHIYTSNGVSLHELSLSLSRGRRFSTSENDDLCSICADGGDLLCCDGCPRAFHKECIPLQNAPADTWFCKYCENMFQKERFVERNANALAAGRIAGTDPIEQITKRCIRIVKTPGAEFDGCAICRVVEFSKSGFTSRTVIICDQCEKEYHVGCLKEHGMADLQKLPEGEWFCCASCSTIHSALEKLVNNGEEVISGSLLNVIKKKNEAKEPGRGPTPDVKWRILRAKMVSDKTRPLLSKAVAIFHEQFDPILESGTNRDFIPNMVYGRNMRENDFGNMLCAVLMVNSLVVSAGIFRIFGQEVAELPLVATCGDFQGQGYFQCLFSCIERLLVSLDVKNFLLPSAEEAQSIWTKKFGFSQISQDELKTYRLNHPLMTFTGTTMLQKLVPKLELPVDDSS